MKKQKKPVPPAEAEPVIKKQPLLKRLLFGPERPDLSELEAGSTTILDILSPTAIDTKSRDYIVVDGVFHAYLYITGYGYSTTVGSCWLAPLVEAGEGVNVSFSFTRQNREKILSKIAQTTMLNRSRMRDVGDTRQDYEELDSAITSGLYLKDVMNRQGEDFYYKAANKILSAYLNLLTVYPDQPYDQPEIIHPISGCTIVKPEDMADFQTVLPKEEKVLEIVRAKIAAGERVMIYTSWTRTDRDILRRVHQKRSLL